MAPMHGAMNRRHRVVLKEDVKAAIDSAQTIWVVEPSLRGPDVKGGEAGISHGANATWLAASESPSLRAVGWCFQERGVSGENQSNWTLG